MPNDFVLYLNGSHAPKGFKPYPSDWPDMDTRAFIHYGVYRNLIGQFAFDFKIDSIKTFAMGIPKNLLFSFENPTYMLLSSTIHEGFHQYQHSHFGEIPWAREELYPILDVENTALASLEMQILKDALNAMFKNNEKKVETLAKEFVAVRDYRWKHADGFVRKYEQGQEINEGTARYVEMKAMDCFLKLDTAKIQNQLFREIKKDMSGMTIQNLLIGDMDARLSGLAVAPDDMLRNRIYPVGAALGFLMDRLGILWKMKFQAAGTEVSFPGLLKKRFKLDSIQLLSLFEKAKADFHYPEIMSSAKQLIHQYFTEYQEALKKFNHQKGIRIEINLSNNGLQRFRSTKDKKWIVENGKKLLCLHYNLYSLKSFKGNNILLEVHDKAIFDQNDWKKRQKKVAFYCNNLSNLILDNSPLGSKHDIEQNFNRIKLTGNDFKFEAEIKGKFSLKKNEII
ncbi:MAG: hypothetical protein GXO85_12945, partial [Chlorobi bacterium]|nr:hypothetical protein [Chlorobiota bacterium]